MLNITIWIIIFIAGLYTLIKASDYFTDSAEKIGLHLKMPAFIVGVTIVAIGTSLPELISSLFAVMQNSSEIVVGNVIGSNIANIFLVLGVAAIMGKKLKVHYGLVHVDLPILFGATMLFTIAIWDQHFSTFEAILSLALLFVYMKYTISTSKKDKEIKKEIKKRKKIKKQKLDKKVWWTLILSTIFIFFGAKYTIDSVIQISEILNIATEIIAVSAIALGTSLPELFVSITAAKKGNPEMAIGNVLGSNIFNTLAVMGIPALFGKLIIPASMLTFALPVMIIATLTYYFTTQDREVTQWEGWMLVILYILFIGKLFNLF
ncbi:calcium/sodium antiporter [Candidatus Woesearchaeota archaeon]|nr:calcium/sodium antiporter [Candidatus Woesearchaeota archaeon]